MITVDIYRNSEGYISSFEIRGHSGYAERGQDIVCAGVSAVSQTALLGLEKVLGEIPVVRKGDGTLAVTVGHPKKAQVILETMLLGLQDISRGYPRFVRINDEEVRSVLGR